MIAGTPLVAGAASGQALVTHEALSFWGGYDQLTGEIIDRRHPLSGQNARGRVLVIPASRGSSTTTAVLLESVRNGTQPAAIVCTVVDHFFSLASIVADEMYALSFPVIMVRESDFLALHSGDLITIAADGTLAVEASTGTQQ